MPILSRRNFHFSKKITPAKRFDDVTVLVCTKIKKDFILKFIYLKTLKGMSRYLCNEHFDY